MPRKMRLRRRSTGWSEEHIRIMKDGHDFFGLFDGADGQPDLLEMFKCWTETKADILIDWIRDNPGSRPWGWWQFDRPAKSRRERADGGTHPHDRPGADQKRELYFGRPRMVTGVDINAVFESEASFLERHDLLTAAERTVLRMEN